MPPQRRASRPAATKPAEAPARHAKADGPICAECWPSGWRERITSAGCIHGSWQRYT